MTKRERMANYRLQNGTPWRITDRQRRRVIKKMHRAQKAWEVINGPL